MSNQILVSADHLESISEQIVLLNIDNGHLAMALQAVQVDCAVSGGVINAVIMALSGNAATTEDIADQLHGMLSAPQEEVADHE
ncbi:hypothetical protein FHS24_002176 [Psychrobacter luti]|uniref:Uncharacterized protein n=1 Tax=Psychrobacter luti TaxID=198481 RepID=A0A839TI10_9GAMM|nr:hypothetical protein [Psychrobacter luti]MBB3107645.1 hypothetical protein [Psychrobacter luti]